MQIRFHGMPEGTRLQGFGSVEANVTTPNRPAEKVVPTEGQEKPMQLEKVSKELDAVRREFAERYREAAIALGKYYSLGIVRAQLGNELGEVVSLPNPDPLPELEQTHGRIETAQSYRHRLSMIPLYELSTNGKIAKRRQAAADNKNRNLVAVLNQK